MSDLLERAGTIYEYIKMKKKACTYMQVRPQQNLVEKHVEGLGFVL